MPGGYIVGIALLAVVAYVIWLRGRTQSSPKPCAQCGRQSRHGYSDQPETRLEDIEPLCTGCLISRLEQEYRSYPGMALVIQPAIDYPCYLFQSNANWASSFPASKAPSDIDSVLSQMGSHCDSCGRKPQYFWVSSSGFTPEMLDNFLDRGPSSTIMQGSPHTASLCAKCCVTQISKTIAHLGVEYVEVCAPRGTASGFVVPMGY